MFSFVVIMYQQTYIDGLAQDYGNRSALAIELPQSFAEPLTLSTDTLVSVSSQVKIFFQLLSSLLPQMDWDLERDDAWSMTISTFNPYQCELAPLEVRSSQGLLMA